MSNLINRQEAIDILTSRVVALKGVYGDLGGAVSGARKLIESLPSVELERTATVTENWGLAMCNGCKRRVIQGDVFCSHCGARLDWSE